MVIIHAKTLEEFSKFDSQYDHLLETTNAETAETRCQDAMRHIGSFLQACATEGVSPSLKEIANVYNEAVDMTGEPND